MEHKDCVVVLCYRRVSHLKAVLDSLSNSIRVEEHLTVFVIQDPIADILELVDSYKQPKIVLTLDGKTYNSSAQAINGNLFHGLEFCFEQLLANRVIVLEDDIVISKDALQFFHEVFDLHESCNKFRGVNGFSEMIPTENEYDAHVRVNHGLGWGWSINRKIYRKIRKTWTGKEDNHWDFSFEPYVRTGFVVNPVRSRIMNIGFDETATHTSRDIELGERIWHSFDHDTRDRLNVTREKKGSFIWREKDISVTRLTTRHWISRRILYLVYFFFNDSRGYHSLKRRLGLSVL